MAVKSTTKAVKEVVKEEVDVNAELMKQLQDMKDEMAKMQKALVEKDKKIETVEKDNVEIAKQHKTLDRQRRIAVRSVREGGLTYVSKATGLNTYWNDYGDEHYMEVEELIRMKSSSPAFLTKPWIMIDDEEVVEYLSLKTVYDAIIPIDELDSFFSKPVSEIDEAIKKAPIGTKELIRDRAYKMVSTGDLDSNKVIRAIEQNLKIDLSIAQE